MNLMIIVKWFKYDYKTSGCAPSILINLINMFLYKYIDDNDASQPCYLKNWYGGQQFFQTIFLLAAFICVPWMLVLKPYILKKQNDLKLFYHPSSEQEEVIVTIENGDKSAAIHGGHDDKPFELGEVVINQSIHTIEYCLGSISHTASYLRLWALSLAHAQLSEVLWNMVFRIGLQGEGIMGGIIMYLVFSVWAVLTVSVLIVMEGLSAFLHALRLHW